jgi:hypothetical protein
MSRACIEHSTWSISLQRPSRRRYPTSAEIGWANSKYAVCRFGKQPRVWFEEEVKLGEWMIQTESYCG